MSRVFCFDRLTAFLSSLGDCPLKFDFIRDLVEKRKDFHFRAHITPILRKLLCFFKSAEGKAIHIILIGLDADNKHFFSIPFFAGFLALVSILYHIFMALSTTFFKRVRIVSAPVSPPERVLGAPDSTHAP